MSFVDREHHRGAAEPFPGHQGDRRVNLLQQWPRCEPSKSCCAYAWEPVICSGCGKIECGHRPCPVCWEGFDPRPVTASSDFTEALSRDPLYPGRVRSSVCGALTGVFGAILKR
jgi:hypothetical protein